jgi:hypothetical protein
MTKYPPVTVSQQNAKAAVPRPSKTPAVSSSVVSLMTKSPPVTLSQQNAKAAVPWPSKTPAVSSPLVSQTTKAVQSPGTVREKMAKAAVAKIPTFSSQVRSYSEFQAARSESTQGVFVKPGATAVESEGGGVIVKSLGEHSPTEQTTPNSKVLGIFPHIEAWP